MFARLLECGGEVEAFRAIGRILPLLDRPAIDDLSHRLAALPSPDPASATIGPESRFIMSSLRGRILTGQSTTCAAGWSELSFNDEDAATLARSPGGDRATLLAHLDSTGPVFAELARRLDLPRPSCQVALDEFASFALKSHPIVANVVDSAWGVRHMVDRMLALRAMLRAGVALVCGGEHAFHRVVDPHGNGPFELERRENGYVIRSALNDHGKPEVISRSAIPPENDRVSHLIGQPSEHREQNHPRRLDHAGAFVSRDRAALDDALEGGQRVVDQEELRDRRFSVFRCFSPSVARRRGW